MSDYSKISYLVSGKPKNIDLASNTLVLGNAKIGGATNYLTFNVAAVTGAVTVTMPNASVDLGNLLAKDLVDGKIWVGSSGGVASAVTMSGNVTISNLGVTAIAALAITNAMVSESAAIVYSKLSIADGDLSIAKVSGLSSALSGKVATSVQINGHALTSDVTVTKTDLSLNNVDNVQQLPMSYLDTDNTLAANSDAKVASQKAIKAYVSSQVSGAIVGAIVYKGVFDASAGNFSAISSPKQGWLYKVSVAGTIPAQKALLLSQGITYTAKTAGAAGNLISVHVIDSSSGGLAYTEVSGAVLIDLGGATPTTAQVVTLLSGSAYVDAVETTPGSVIIHSAQLLASGADALDLVPSDNLYLNKDVVGTPKIVDFDKIDNTESPDIVRTSADSTLASGVTIAVNSATSFTQYDLISKGYVDTAIGAISGAGLSRVVGESLSANVTYALRQNLNGETSARIYKADNDDSSSDKFYVLGLYYGASKSAADTVSLVTLGSVHSSVDFVAADQGKPVFLGSNGLITLSPPSAAGTACFRIGIVEAYGSGTSSICISNMQYLGSN